MNKCCGKLGWFALIGCLCLVNAICSATAMAQDTIGVIAEAIKPEIAEKLKLSEEAIRQDAAIAQESRKRNAWLSQQLRIAT